MRTLHLEGVSKVRAAPSGQGRGHQRGREGECTVGEGDGRGVEGKQLPAILSVSPLLPITCWSSVIPDVRLIPARRPAAALGGAGKGKREFRSAGEDVCKREGFMCVVSMCAGV